MRQDQELNWDIHLIRSQGWVVYQTDRFNYPSLVLQNIWLRKGQWKRRLRGTPIWQIRQWLSGQENREMKSLKHAEASMILFTSSTMTFALKVITATFILLGSLQVWMIWQKMLFRATATCHNWTSTRAAFLEDNKEMFSTAMPLLKVKRQSQLQSN